MDVIGRPGRKHRAWQGFISVSASGPDFSPELTRRGVTARPRLAADLRYTTADAAFFAEYWDRPWYDSGHEELHVPHLQNPAHSEVVTAFIQASDWLGERACREDWDGGHLTFCFAGHGRDGDGALVIDDEVVTAADLTSLFMSVASQWSPERRLRLAVILDSCHSGAFLLDFLERTLREPRLRIEYLAAASMPDEFAWEDPGLGHGVFTYCWSVRPGSGQSPLGALVGEGVQPDNTLGPSLGVAQGPFGCSLMTYGRQNPVTFLDGALSTCGGGVEVDMEDTDGHRQGWEKALLEIRDRFRSSVADLHPSVRIDRYLATDAEARAAIEEILNR
jgi:hypothetical protein